MKKLKLLILLFTAALSIPLAFLVIQIYRGLDQEETATLRYFGEALFDEMEQALGDLVQREEGRAIDEYNFYFSSPGGAEGSVRNRPSPLSHPPKEDFILGYFQNNPDGSFQTPLVESGKRVKADRNLLVGQLEYANKLFNRKRVASTDRIKAAPAETLTETVEKREPGFADKYLDLSHSQKPRAYLGQKDKRVEKITVGQASNIAKQGQKESRLSSQSAEEESAVQPAEAESAAISGRSDVKSQVAAETFAGKTKMAPDRDNKKAEDQIQPSAASDEIATEGFQVEVAPLQSVFIDDDQIYIFRRIMIDNRIYRQGFILRPKAFLDHLAAAHFISQPMAQYTNLRLRVVDQGRETRAVEVGITTNGAEFLLNRTFPSPFSFLEATLTCDQIPRSAGRRTMNIMMIILVAVVLMGLFAIYQSARTIVDLSERRSQFVSSVTHELKTPLTNIRMYIEMLEQGVARDPEREQEYFRILDSEGARLTRLINNVLELSKLEKKQRHIDLQTGTFEEVIEEVKRVMQAKLNQEGFTLTVEADQIRPFAYDREVMIQVLINLIENSMKFGKTAARRQIRIRIHQDKNWVNIRVSDTGPGIPRHALKKVFDDFYRVDNSLTRSTRGTGIGLGLVKKFVTLVGGTVVAGNNDGPGCTITICLPS